MSRPPFQHMDDLLQRLLDDQVEPDEMQRLAKAIREDPQVRDYYVDSLLVCAMIRRSSQVTGELSKSDLMRAISSGAGQGGSGGLGRRLRSIAAVLLLGALAAVAACLFRYMDRGPAIGTLAGEYEAQWRRSRPRPGQALYARSYDLLEGVAEMRLGEGARIVLEAPCRVELKGVGELALKKGRLAAVILPQAQGFQVQTPTALITDLGTEFGVIARGDGSSEAHALKGRISVAPAPDGSAQSLSRVLNERFAAVVDADGRTIRSDLAARADLFLVQLPSVSRSSGPVGRVDLADIVGGGNGRGTGRLDQGIDSVTGQALTHPATRIRQARRSEFRPTRQFRGIDGVFVPNGALGPVVISSTGLTFPECPATLGSYYGGPANSGKFYDIPSQRTYSTRLNGVTSGTSRYPALNLHPNAGITFDLDPIRRDNPNVRIDRFSAVCGVPKDVPQPPFSPADVWVLLDGAVRQHLNYPVGGNVEKVDIPIPPQARFLTLVTTCSGRADYSWILFGDPFLGPAATAQEEAGR